MPSTALVVEDGTGTNSATANTFVSVAQVTQYCSDRGLAFGNGTTQAQQEASIIEAGEYLQNEDRYAWRGVKNAYAQTMPWPRTGAREFRGQSVPSNSIPWRVVQAQCYLAYLSSLAPGQLQVTLTRGGMIKTKTIDVVTTTFMDNAPVENVIQKVSGLLAPLLQKSGINRINTDPYFSPSDGDPYVVGEFDNPSISSGLTDGIVSS